MESRKAHILENGGSNPSPAILEYNSVVEFHAFSVQCQWFDSPYSSYQKKQGVPVRIAWVGGSIPQVGSSGVFPLEINADVPKWL